MPTFNDPEALARAQLARARALRSRIRTEHAQMCNELYEEGYKLLSGSVSNKALVAMGHPLGRGTTKGGTAGRQRRSKDAKGYLPPLPINVQSGKLRDALRMVRRGQGDTQQYVLNVSRALAPYARYVLGLGGTRLMVTRPFWATLEKSWKRRNFELLRRMRDAQRKP